MGDSLVGQDGSPNLDDRKSLRRDGCEVRQVLLDLPLRPHAAQCLNDYATGAEIGELLGRGGQGAAGAFGKSCAGNHTRCSGLRLGQSSASAGPGPEGPDGRGQHGSCGDASEAKGLELAGEKGKQGTCGSSRLAEGQLAT